MDVLLVTASGVELLVDVLLADWLVDGLITELLDETFITIPLVAALDEIVGWPFVVTPLEKLGWTLE